jgi:Tfp pilus assembly protein PilE
MLTKKGFNAVEAAIVIMAIIIVVAIAIPLFTRSNISSNESAAISSLHRIGAAFEYYRTLKGAYPTTFAQLCSVQPPMLDGQLCTGKKQGYDFVIETTDIVPTYAFRILAQCPENNRNIMCKRSFKLGSSSSEANGVAYYALSPSGPWTPIGYEPGEGSSLLDEGDNPCESLCCSSCPGAGCVTSIPPCPASEPVPSCPYVHVWTGKEFVKDNDIIPAGNPDEYTDYYKLAKAPAVDKTGLLALKIVEPLDEKTYLDRLELIEVIHPSYVKIAPTPEGKLFTFREQKLKPALKAVDKRGKDVLADVSRKLGGNYHGKAGDFIVFDFEKIRETKQGLRLILSSDLEPAYAGEEVPVDQQEDSCLGPGGSLHIEVLLNNNSWQELSVIHPHADWDIWLVDLTPFIEKIKGKLKIKVGWTAEHKLDFCLLDTSSQVLFKANKLALISASHSRKGNVLKLLNSSDNKYSRMVKGDEIALKFSGLKSGLDKKEVKDYILVSEGFYKSLIPKR